jgi:hypothetical protein
MWKHGNNKQQLIKGILPKRLSSSFLMDTRPSSNQVRYSFMELIKLRFALKQCWLSVGACTDWPQSPRSRQTSLQFYTLSVRATPLFTTSLKPTRPNRHTTAWTSKCWVPKISRWFRRTSDAISVAKTASMQKGAPDSFEFAAIKVTHVICTQPFLQMLNIKHQWG